MIGFLILLLHVLVSPFKTHARLEAEIVLLRHQLSVSRGPVPALDSGPHSRECVPRVSPHRRSSNVVHLSAWNIWRSLRDGPRAHRNADSAGFLEGVQVGLL